MACGSCGQARAQRAMTHEEAQAMMTGQAPRYTVQAPDGTSQTFDRYIDAAVHRRQVNGVITTHT